MKRILIFALALTLCLSAFCGCSKKDNAEDEIYIPIRKGNQVNYNTVHAYRGTILEQVVLDAQFSTPYSTDLSFTMMEGTIAELNVHEEMDVKAGDVIATLDHEALEDEITIQKIKLDSAKSTYEILQKKGSEDEIAFAKIDMDIEQAKYDDLVARREFLTLTAPYDGKITYVGRYRSGSKIAKNATLCTIVDTSRVCLAAIDFEGKLNDVGFGAKVDIQQGAIASTTGTVVDVVTEEYSGDFGFGDFGGGNRSVSLKRFVIKPDEDVKFEDFGTIQATFTTLRRDDTVIVPSEAVFEFGNGHAVNVLINGVKIQTTVSLGIISGDKTEIISGLDGTETLVVP